MPLESGAQFLAELSPLNPLGADDLRAGDDHIRLMKRVLQQTLPNAQQAYRLRRWEPRLVTRSEQLSLADEGRLIRVIAAPTGTIISLPPNAPTDWMVTVRNTSSVNNFVRVTLPRGEEFECDFRVENDVEIQLPRRGMGVTVIKQENGKWAVVSFSYSDAPDTGDEGVTIDTKLIKVNEDIRVVINWPNALTVPTRQPAVGSGNVILPFTAETIIEEMPDGWADAAMPTQINIPAGVTHIYAEFSGNIDFTSSSARPTGPGTVYITRNARVGAEIAANTLASQTLIRPAEIVPPERPLLLASNYIAVNEGDTIEVWGNAAVSGGFSVRDGRLTVTSVEGIPAGFSSPSGSETATEFGLTPIPETPTDGADDDAFVNSAALAVMGRTLQLTLGRTRGEDLVAEATLPAGSGGGGSSGGGSITLLGEFNTMSQTANQWIDLGFAFGAGLATSVIIGSGGFSALAAGAEIENAGNFIAGARAEPDPDSASHTGTYFGSYLPYNMAHGTMSIAKNSAGNVLMAVESTTSESISGNLYQISLG